MTNHSSLALHFEAHRELRLQDRQQGQQEEERHNGDAETEGAAALRVLTNAALFEQITDLMLGVPKFVLEFAKSMEPKYKPLYSRRHHQWRGVLPFMAIQENNMRVLKALYELQRLPQHRSNAKLQFHRVVVAAVKYGRLEIVKWLREQQATDPQLVWDTGLMREAIWNRHVEILEWLNGNGFPSETVSCGVQDIDWSEREGTFDIIMWLHSHQFHFTPREMDQAAKYGHCDIVRFLHEHRSEGCTANAMDAAAANGHLTIVQFLHRNRMEGCTAHAMDDAAEKGHLDIVRFLHANRTEGCTEHAMDSAAMNNHVDVIKFLGLNRREGCSPVLLVKVAKYGNADTVRALCAHSARGCLVEARRVAMAWKHTEVVAILDGYISAKVWSCSMAQHSRDGPRRCQTLGASHTPCSTPQHPRRTVWSAVDILRMLFQKSTGKSTVVLPPSMRHTHSFRPV